MRSVQNKFKQSHQEFVQVKIRENCDAKFTAQALVNHIIAHYLTDNIAQFKLLERQIEKMIGMKMKNSLISLIAFRPL